MKFFHQRFYFSLVNLLDMLRCIFIYPCHMMYVSCNIFHIRKRVSPYHRVIHAPRCHKTCVFSHFQIASIPVNRPKTIIFVRTHSFTLIYNLHFFSTKYTFDAILGQHLLVICICPSVIMHFASVESR
jgi:hypothetical protein